ncbi:glycosyltransferase [Bdellovibrio sp. 22V]|uniref:MGDG synthase family glycosyltransferase n=1 Tax=Bdellovibrio sp. 22V TaxID=3044166 RepID=UPI0025430514|nr:glycosyltransferase [Bdellovibrio sp. 22V]WII72712.1 glycosyltransferase [Bdellovibrio sp. 22V]
MRVLFRISVSFFISLFFASLAFAQKTLILYSSIGMGHLSASRAIEEKIKAQNPQAEVELKNIRDFMPSMSRTIDEKMYWFVFKKMPQTFSNAYLSSMQKGMQVRDLSDIKTGYNETALLDYIRKSGAETVIATHYGSAINLGNLKSSGKLPGIKTAWVHTDYIEHYFPRISQRLDKTFVGHNELANSWKEFGVKAEKVEVTGIPVRNLPEPGEVQRGAVLEAVGLKAEPVTFVMSGGSEGLRDYPTAVKSLAQQFKDPIQIVAVCGKNEKARSELEKLAATLPPHVTLKPLGFIPNKQLIDLISVADLYVTKSGGLSPTEGALLMKPLVLINEYGGHEAENAEFFKKTKMAEIVNSSAELGGKAVSVLANPELMKQMMEHQREYRNSVNLDYIANWTLNDKAQETVRIDLGLKEGAMVEGTTEALAKLSRDFPGDVEVLLSYPKSKTGTYFGDGKESNPFGHIAIRVGENVYTINHMAERGSEPHIVHKSSLAEYLYSTKTYYRNEEFTGMQGQAYAKDTLAVRLDGLSNEAIKNMLNEIATIDRDWKEGRLNYVAKTCNCADVTLRVLKAGGVVVDGKIFKRSIKMPLDVFDAVVKAAENRPDLQSSLIHYGYVKSSKNEFKTAGFPLSLYQIKRAIVNMFKKGRDKIETRINARLTVNKDSSELSYEKTKTVQKTAPKGAVGMRCEAVFN